MGGSDFANVKSTVLEERLADVNSSIQSLINAFDSLTLTILNTADVVEGSRALEELERIRRQAEVYRTILERR